MTTNPYRTPKMSGIAPETNAVASSIVDEHKSVAVRICAVFGIVFVIVYETYYAIAQSIQWRDCVHLIAAAGTIYFLFSAYKNGHWGIRNRNKVSSADSENNQ